MKKKQAPPLRSVRVALTSIVWPFFLKNIWPLVQDEVTAMIKKAMAFLGKTLDAKLDEQNRQRANEAENRAQQAAHQAEQAKNDVDVAKYQAQAEVWRQVAQELRHDNERLRQELSSVVASVSAQAETNLRDIQIDVIGETAQLTANGKTIALSAPPEE